MLSYFIGETNRQNHCSLIFHVQINNGRGLPWASREVNNGTPFPHQHFKVFQYLGYYGRCNDLEAVMFILENCVGLQQIINDPAMQLGLLHIPLDPDELEQEEGCRSYAKQ
ncbi:unnamed protein product [Cuscuta epithymum]|uniref:FBD domain-containing protein n=1 Tax=Cuscuta epithymum TaxID=186058 RepID=A0AAV0FCR0_9ASTE|nr:unnamed protein product [Cuscuta epithymum]